MLRRLAALSLTALLLVPLSAFLGESIGWAPKAITLLLVIVSVVSPRVGLLSVAAFVPLATSILTEVRSGTAYVRFAEALVLAYLCGWYARFSVRRTGVSRDRAALWCAVGLAIAAVSSGVVTLVSACAEEAATPASHVLRRILIAEYAHSGHPITAAFLLLEGVVLFIAVCAEEMTPDARQSIVAMMCLGAAGTAMVDLLRLVVGAARAVSPLTSFVTYFMDIRLSVNFVDVNAAGSYFALLLFMAIYLSRRSLAAVCTIPIGIGLWLSGSRVALAAVALCVSALALSSVDRAARRRIGVIGGLVAGVAALTVIASVWHPSTRSTTLAGALQWREQMAAAALKITASHPWSGVGLGNFYDASAAYVPVRENAHNNFLQILAELGIPGFLLFASLVALVMLGRRTPHNDGLKLGLAAFLLTCVGGHPLLVGGVAYAFWIALGVAAHDAAPDMFTGVVRRGAVALTIALTITLPFRIANAARAADRENAVSGFAPIWQRDADGRRYRWAAGRAAFYVNARIKAVAIPLRAASGDGAIEVRVLLDGREANRVLLEPDGRWETVRLVFPNVEDYHRIDIESRRRGSPETVPSPVTNVSGAVMVGQPELMR
jgi:O-antigen ligase